MHVLNTTLPAHLSLFACLDFLRATHCLEYLAFCVPRLFACYSPREKSRFLRASTFCVLLTAWSLSLFAYLDFLRATHPVKNLASCVPRLFACYSPLWNISLLAYLDFACCRSSRGRRLLLVAEDVSFDWPAIAQHMRTHVQFHISCGLSLFAYLDFCELQMDAFGEHLLRLGSDVVRGERLRCGRLGPSPAT